MIQKRFYTAPKTDAIPPLGVTDKPSVVGALFLVEMEALMIFSSEVLKYEQRLMKNVVKDENGCWNFTGCRDEFGYGRMSMVVKRLNRRYMIRTHRLSYLIFKGEINSLLVCHHCDHPSCVNPDHLEPVTSQINNLRSNGMGAINSRKKHCVHGHELAGENLCKYELRHGRRKCLTCQKAVKKARKLALRRTAAMSPAVKEGK